jgi:hypothetical protein
MVMPSTKLNELSCRSDGSGSVNFSGTDWTASQVGNVLSWSTQTEGQNPNANAIRWQVWMALLVYVLLRYLGYVSRWEQSFARLWGLVRAGLWKKFDLLDLLQRWCGTAQQRLTFRACPEQAYFPGF